MNKPRSFLSFLIKKLWTLIAIVLVIFALFISFLRYSLPYLNDYKGYVQEYVSERYEVELSVDELSANWQSNGPIIILRGVNIEKGVQSPIALKAQEVLLEIDFWPSISSRKLQSNQVILNGLELDVELNQIEASDSDFPIIEALENVFMDQLSNFSVTNSRLQLISQKNSKTIEIEHLSWLNEGNRHQGVGVFALRDFSDNNATFVLDLIGDVNSYNGVIYAQAQELNLSSWFNEYFELDSQLVSSTGNIEVWGRITNSELKRIDGHILPSILEWQTGEYTIKNKLQAEFAGSKQDNQWIFSVDDLSVSTDEQTFTTRLNGAYSSDNGVNIQVVEPFSITSLLPITGLFSLASADQIALMDPQLTLASLQMQISDNGVSAKSVLDGIEWQQVNEVVGINNLQVKLWWHQNKGKFLIHSDLSELKSEYLFGRDIQLTSLDIPIYFDDGKISVKPAQFYLDELLVGINVQYALKTDFLSLALNLEPMALAKIPSLLPNHFLGRGAKAFLTRAFQGQGNITKANVIWHGQVFDFPYTDKQGVFQSQVNIQNADFLFSTEWPALRKLNINLLFENQSLTMQSPSSYLGQVALSNLAADIPKLTGDAVLTIKANGQADSKDITTLMLESALSNSLGKLLDKDLVVEGKLLTELQLSIPLDDRRNTRATGFVELAQNKVNLRPLGLTFTDAKGRVLFDNETIDVKGLQANLFDQAILVDLQGKQTEESYDLDLNLNANWDAALLANNIGSEFSNYVDGKVDLDLKVDVQLKPQNFLYQAKLTSNLVGLTSNLPAPFEKNNDESLALELIAQGNNTASSVNIDLANIAKFDGALPHKEKKFNRAHLSIGPTEFESRGVGFSISADLDTFYAQQWSAFIEALGANFSESNTPIIEKPQRIFIKTQKMLIGEQSATDVDITVKRLQDHWAIDLDANEMRGNATVYDDLFGKGILVDAEYIKLNEGLSSSAERPKLTLQANKLPKLNFTCKSCQIYGLDLGRVELETEPNDDGLKINQFLINNEQGNVNASGQWYKRNQDHYTFVAGELNSKDFGEFLQNLGFDSGIQDSQADMSFALTWKDSPFDLAFENLDGEVDWRLSDGYLTEVSDKGSRIFTLLSLNSLVRKLSLDFRDVFAKGFFYDNIGGSLQITEGKADTRDTKIDGAAGEIEIYGYTDLASKQLNYNVSFTPNVTGNLPVLVYFFTVSPPSALAALALDQVLTSTKVISNVNYSVTGTIDDPILIETGRESTEVELPARRELDIQENAPEFIPPTKDDLLKVEEQDGQSD